MKNLYFIFRLLFFTSNKCFSHFDVQQLLSNKSYFVLVSQAHLKTTLKMKTFEKICFIRYYWISNTKVRFTLFKLFWSETWKSKNYPYQCAVFKKKSHFFFLSEEMSPHFELHMETVSYFLIQWISVDLLISTCLTRWFDLFNHNP